MSLYLRIFMERSLIPAYSSYLRFLVKLGEIMGHRQHHHD